VTAMVRSRRGSLGLFAELAADALHLRRGLAPGNAHDFHQLGGHLGGHLILNAALAVGIGVQELQNSFPGDAGLLEAVEKLSVAHSAAQLGRPREQLFAIAAGPSEKARARAEIIALAHDPQSLPAIISSPPSRPPTGPENPRSKAGWSRSRRDGAAAGC